MPAPLKEKTELDMWRLACSSTCQFCGKRDTRRTFPATDPLRGPGLEGVARVWEFRPPDPPAKKEKTSEEIDAEWDLIQGPVRLKILRYADEAIIGDWDDGDKVTKDNAPAFAADILLHVRKRFYTEVENDAKAARAFGREPTVDPVGGPFTQKLTLENLKYVFDVKVKPITSKFRTDLFLCPVCDASMKFFGFEGAIQHYAAKHTNILSVGNIVVYWRAEWPEDPPFRPNPRTAKGTGLPVPLPQSPTAKLPNQRGPGPAAKRSGKDHQQFGAAQTLHYQGSATQFPPPPSQLQSSHVQPTQFHMQANPDDSDNGRGQVRSNRRRSTSVHLMNHSLEERIKMLVLSPLDRQHSLLFLRLRDQLFPRNIKL
ncbi:hypothetical protein HMPREF1624_03601 [Sporothrix schenckii ATCC 58251]|uniref:Uncharacterized protein n=1 Tax=Sporothrix schenckii (strain ATCC 58251 / de Perez 2211183) TaxID=1391915 RepID=U7PZQ1_SPOS1|nr:hypothetical protein HMPREF1624_03601 [Sporothrix schenckii ATCC 58251]